MVLIKLSLIGIYLCVFILISKGSNQGDESDEENYDEIGEKFMSLLSDDLKMKIMKNKEDNQGLLDPDNLKKQHLTKEELAEVQAALVEAMQPLFGKFVSELATNLSTSDEEEMPKLGGPEKKLFTPTKNNQGGDDKSDELPTKGANKSEKKENEEMKDAKGKKTHKEKETISKENKKQAKKSDKINKENDKKKKVKKDKSKDEL